MQLQQFSQVIKHRLPKLELHDQAYQQLYWLSQECLRWSAVHNLTSFKTLEEFIDGHIIDSLSLINEIKHIPQGKSWLDFGTGAGFPGLVLAICRRDLLFHLLDSHKKKMAFVMHAKSQLKLENVNTICCNVTNYHHQYQFDFIIARAVSSIDNILSLTNHLLNDQGYFWLLKGPNWQDEKWSGKPTSIKELRQNPSRFLLIIEKQSS